MEGFKNVCAYVENRGIITCDIAVDKGKIVEIGNDLDIDSPYLTDCSEKILVPGFIDEHIHGAANADAMDGEECKLGVIADYLASEGTTAFLATTMTQSPDNIVKALKTVNGYIAKEQKNGARVLGVHLEGPFISPKHVGAQPPEYVAEADIDTFELYDKASGNNIKLVTLAPEIKNASRLISYITSKGIRVSAGHTDADYDQIENSVKCGLECVTHTFNAQRGIHHRNIGTAGAALAIDDVYAEMICDLTHLSVPAIKLIVKNKPEGKVILITDSMRAKGLPDGISELGGQQVTVKNGQARLSNGALAGSILRMNDAIKNLVTFCDVPFERAIDFATVNPAKNIGVDKNKGSIAVGKDADFALLDKAFNVSLTVREGRVIFKK